MKRLLAALLLLCLLPLSAAFLEEDKTLTLTFVGDTSIGDAFQFRKSKNSYHKVVEEKGYDWPFSLVKDVMLSDDLTIANLEGSMTRQTRHRQDIRFPLYIHPDHLAILKAGGIDVVNTANNHAKDFFDQGYQDTLDTLDAGGIPHFGTLSPPSKTGADRQAIVEVKGIKIGILGYTYPQEHDLKLIAKVVPALREQGCQLIILSLHWGRETFMQPNATQYSFAKKAFALDVDLIYGHHPHVVQPIALFEGKPIFFSTGNFTFGTMSKVDPTTGLFQAVYDLSGDKPRLAAIRVVPCLTSGSGDYRPVPITEQKEREKAFKKLSFKKPPKGFEALPDSFLSTGEAVFD